MNKTLFNSDFAKNSKFDKSFVGNISNKSNWIYLAAQFEYYLTNLEMNNSSELFIPKKIHQIWLGSKNPPKKYIPYMKSWQKYKINPTFRSFNFYTNNWD